MHCYDWLIISTIAFFLCNLLGSSQFFLFLQNKLQLPSIHGAAGKGRKWKLWRSSSGDHGSLWRGSKGGSHRSAAASEASDDASSLAAAAADMFSAALATVARAPAKDFMAVRQEWACIRIQTAFRGFLVRNSSSRLTDGLFSDCICRVN
jgi:hypothetical protein